MTGPVEEKNPASADEAHATVTARHIISNLRIVKAPIQHCSATGERRPAKNHVNRYFDYHHPCGYALCVSKHTCGISRSERFTGQRIDSRSTGLHYSGVCPVLRVTISRHCIEEEVGVATCLLRGQKIPINGLTLIPWRRMESVTTISVSCINSSASLSGKPCCMAYIR
jgi:hypothetical protein